MFKNGQLTDVPEKERLQRWTLKSNQLKTKIILRNEMAKIIHGTIRADVADLATLANFFNKKGITFYSMNMLYRKIVETLAYSATQEDPLCKVTDEILAAVILKDIKNRRKEKTYVKLEEHHGTEDYLDKLKKAEQLLKKEN